MIINKMNEVKLPKFSAVTKQCLWRFQTFICKSEHLQKIDQCFWL